MKLKILIALIANIAVIATVQKAAAQPQIVSIWLSGTNQSTNVQIASFQYAKVLTATGAPCNCDSWGQLIFGTSPAISFNIPHRPDGDAAIYVGGTIGTVNAPPLAGLAVAGPTSISVTTGVSSGPILVTLEILPSAYSVTNSVTLGPGQGAAINLEGSTDLVNWSPTTNGVYTAPSAMFFRLHLQRLQ
jgi:hypothetical protein